MENASKALLIAGGVLIGLLVISALLLMFNQISDYNKEQTNTKATIQLANFNQEYTRYARDNLQGVDMISLANKVADYNTRSGTVGEIDYDLPITLTIVLGDKFKDKCGGTLNYFTKSTYEISRTNKEFLNIVEKNRKLESNNTLNGMKQLITYLDSIKNGSMSIEDIIGKPFKDENGNTLSGAEAVQTIQNYEEYSVLKTSTFKISEEPKYHEKGQIKSMKFEFVK